MEIGKAGCKRDVAPFAGDNDECAGTEAIYNSFNSASGDDNFIPPTMCKVSLVGHVQIERLHDVAQARCGEARLKWYGG